jgi:hypothetical protein
LILQFRGFVAELKNKDQEPLKEKAVAQGEVQGETIDKVGLEAEIFGQLARFLNPLETYLKEVADPDFRKAAAKKLREFAAKFDQ